VTGRPTIGPGTEGPVVVEWQRMARRVDATLSLDGDFAEVTEEATRVIQRRAGLPATGVVDGETWAAGEELATVEPRRGSLLIEGDRGDDVRHAQRRLNAHGISTAVDGVYGPRMSRSVRTFQRRNKLPADGTVGRTTWAALG
jgi:peptidoglycan hydrolase-like protein with peptidoglycan-binding domain